MTRNDSLFVPDFVDASAVVEMLESTGIALTDDERVLLEELESLAAQRSPAGAAEEFLAPGVADRAQRWAAFVAAHLFDGLEPAALPRPPWTVPQGARGRPMSRLEQTICRATTQRMMLPVTVSPVLYALAEASATSGELARLAINEVRIGAQAHVRLSGGRDQVERVVVLDAWGTEQVIRRMNALEVTDRSALFAYDGAHPATAKAQASVSGNLSRVLRLAGLDADPTLNPTSIRHSCAVRSYENGAGIEDVAEQIGARSLDKVRRILTELSAR